MIESVSNVQVSRDLFKDLSRMGIIIFLVLNVNSGMSQSDNYLLQDLDSIEISAPRILKPWKESTHSIYHNTTLLQDQQLQLSLKESVISAPSVFASNVHNRAQDLRIAIRGFGARSAFGIRGVKLIVDGIPETTADGQGQLDNLNLGIISRIEVMNNGASALYGNASGGVIKIETLDENSINKDRLFLELGLGITAYNGMHPQFTIGKKWSNTTFIAHLDRYTGDGYRDHSAFESNNINIRIIHKTDRSSWDFIFNYLDSPVAQDPGGVDSTLYVNSPADARDRNLSFNAGEAISQWKASVRNNLKLNNKDKLESYAFFSQREFLGRLPFSNGGIVDLNRKFFGQGASYIKTSKLGSIGWKFLLGYELQAQFDTRIRFVNEMGTTGDKVFDQNEQFRNLAPYLINDYTLDKWIVNLALRYDYNDIEVDDRFTSDGDGAGTILLNDFNYALGLSYLLKGNTTLFANVSTSFETPTLSELSNNPDGSNFNTDLKPQQARHLEIGIKGSSSLADIYQLSFFYVNSDNELLPFELEASLGRVFYRNSGTTIRKGLEFFSTHTLLTDFKLNTKFAYHNFSFGEYISNGDSLEGNRLPGLPDYQTNFQLVYGSSKSLQVLLNYTNQGRIFVNDVNSISQSPKHIFNLSIKYKLEVKSAILSPYVGIDNFLNEQYADNLRVNAFGGRYYEAAPGRYWFAGIRFTLK